MSASLLKYLRQALVQPSEPAPGLQPGQCRHFVVIPVMDELLALPETLASLGLALPDNVGVLLVVNHHPEATAERKQNNLALLEKLAAGESWGLPSRQLFWVDCASPGKEILRGVGEARKIGLDTCLATLPTNALAESYLVCLDADAPVSPRYWQIITAGFQAHPECGALSLGFRHQTGETAAAEQAIRQYEAYMTRYLRGLQTAGSRYAYHSIGSAMAVRASSYLAAGGMRMPSAGEDFYFLQAICKTAPVVQLDEPVVFPAARPSDRVLFGTGPTMSSLLAGGALPELPATAFLALRELLALATAELLLQPEEFANRLAAETREFLQQRRFFTVWPRVLANTPHTETALRRAFDNWFDALKTYQFVRPRSEKI